MTDPAGREPATTRRAAAPALRRLRDRLTGSRAAAVLTIRLAGHPLYAWLLWAAGAVVLASSPVLLADPGLWRFLVDPELVVLMVIVGAQYARITAGLLLMPRRGTGRRGTARRGAARARRPGPRRGRRQPAAPASPGGCGPVPPRLP